MHVARSAGSYELRPPPTAAAEPPPLPSFPPSEGPLPLAGPLELKAPAEGESVAEMARRLEDDGLLYLPAALSPEQTASLRAAIRAAETDKENPVDSGVGTPRAVAVLAEAQAEGTTPEWQVTGNKGVMSLWNRTPEALQYLDLDPTCAVAEATLGVDCHLIQQKGWQTGPGRYADHDLHLDFLPLHVADPTPLLDGSLRVPIYLITAHYYLEDLTGEEGLALGPSELPNPRSVAADATSGTLLTVARLRCSRLRPGLAPLGAVAAAGGASLPRSAAASRPGPRRRLCHVPQRCVESADPCDDFTFPKPC